MSDDAAIPRYDISHFTPRQQAWIELSELFRDTETTDSDIEFLARELHRLGFDAATAEHILQDEVAPVFGKNLLSVAGNWMGWKPESVVEGVNEWLAKRDAPGLRGALYRTRWARRFRAWFFASMVMEDWRRVAQLMQKLP
jgi:hypothetical protein